MAANANELATVGQVLMAPTGRRCASTIAGIGLMIDSLDRFSVSVVRASTKKARSTPRTCRLGRAASFSERSWTTAGD
jgi:hypothetical protein